MAKNGRFFVVCRRVFEPLQTTNPVDGSPKTICKLECKAQPVFLERVYIISCDISHFTGSWFLVFFESLQTKP